MDFICDKVIVREILEFHQQTNSCSKGYPKILEYLETMPDNFAYNELCSKLNDIIEHPKFNRFEDMGARFKNGFLLRMRRYKAGGDWKDLNSKIPKMTRAKRTRIERQAKITKINKNE